MIKIKGLTPKEQQIIAWGLALPLLVLNGWVLTLIIDYFQSPIRIFVIANLIAFILGYPVRWLQRHPHIQLLQAVILVLSLATLLLSLVAITIIPLLATQINQLLQSLPQWAASSSYHLKVLHDWSVQWQLPTDLSRLANTLSEKLPEQLQSIVGQVLGFFIGAAGGIFEAGLIIIIAVYLLLRGQSFWDGIFEWLPRQWRHSIRQSLRRSFQNYYIGQATVATLLSLSLIFVFILFSVPFGLLFGLVIGIMALFPFGGGVSIIIISFLATLNSFWLGIKVLIIATVVDQLVENAIAPRLLGKFTGVHPVWVLLSLMIGAKVAGVLGVLVAVPCTSFVKEMLDSARENNDENLALYEEK